MRKANNISRLAAVAIAFALLFSTIGEPLNAYAHVHTADCYCDGTISELSNIENVDSTCSKCNGTGQYNCANCDGKGTITVATSHTHDSSCYGYTTIYTGSTYNYNGSGVPGAHMLYTNRRSGASSGNKTGYMPFGSVVTLKEDDKITVNTYVYYSKGSSKRHSYVVFDSDSTPSTQPHIAYPYLYISTVSSGKIIGRSVSTSITGDTSAYNTYCDSYGYEYLNGVESIAKISSKKGVDCTTVFYIYDTSYISELAYAGVYGYRDSSSISLEAALNIKAERQGLVCTESTNTTTSECTNCNGRGKFTCDICDGTGHAFVCRECKGNKYSATKCEICNGTGELISYIKGSGIKTQTQQFTEEFKKWHIRQEFDSVSSNLDDYNITVKVGITAPFYKNARLNAKFVKTSSNTSGKVLSTNVKYTGESLFRGLDISSSSDLGYAKYNSRGSFDGFVIKAGRTGTIEIKIKMTAQGIAVLRSKYPYLYISILTDTGSSDFFNGANVNVSVTMPGDGVAEIPYTCTECLGAGYTLDTSRPCVVCNATGVNKNVVDKIYHYTCNKCGVGDYTNENDIGKVCGRQLCINNFEYDASCGHSRYALTSKVPSELNCSGIDNRVAPVYTNDGTLQMLSATAYSIENETYSSDIDTIVSSLNTLGTEWQQKIKNCLAELGVTDEKIADLDAYTAQNDKTAETVRYYIFEGRCELCGKTFYSILINPCSAWDGYFFTVDADTPCKINRDSRDIASKHSRFDKEQVDSLSTINIYKFDMLQYVDELEDIGELKNISVMTDKRDSGTTWSELGEQLNSFGITLNEITEASSLIGNVLNNSQLETANVKYIIYRGTCADCGRTFYTVHVTDGSSGNVAPMWVTFPTNVECVPEIPELVWNIWGETTVDRSDSFILDLPTNGREAKAGDEISIIADMINDSGTDFDVSLYWNELGDFISLRDARNLNYITHANEVYTTDNEAYSGIHGLIADGCVVTLTSGGDAAGIKFIVTDYGQPDKIAISLYGDDVSTKVSIGKNRDTSEYDWEHIRPDPIPVEIDERNTKTDTKKTENSEITKTASTIKWVDRRTGDTEVVASKYYKLPSAVYIAANTENDEYAVGRIECSSDKLRLDRIESYGTTSFRVLADGKVDRATVKVYDTDDLLRETYIFNAEIGSWESSQTKAEYRLKYREIIDENGTETAEYVMTQVKYVEEGETVYWDRPDIVKPNNKTEGHLTTTYELSDWYNVSDGAPFNFSEPVTKNEDIAIKLTIRTVEANKYTVRFIVNGNVISTQQVYEREAAVAPDMEIIERYIKQNEYLSGWDNNNYYKVMCDMDVVANVIEISDDYRVVEEVGDYDCIVQAFVGSTFVVTIPKLIVLGAESNEGTYSITVDADLGGLQYIAVRPTPVDAQGYILHERGNRPDIPFYVTQDKQYFIYDPTIYSSFKTYTNEFVTTDDKVAYMYDSIEGYDKQYDEVCRVQGTVNAELKAGDWSGQMLFDIFIGSKKVN